MGCTPNRCVGFRLPAIVLYIAIVLTTIPVFAQSDNLPVGPTGVLVHSRFGGQIFGFDIDQNGTEGLLAEAKTLSNGNVLAAVETFDQATGDIHKLFLVAQPNSSSAPSGSTIYVYDIHGNLQETINGFSFSNSFNVVAAYIALHPSQRSGYIDGPDAGVTQLQAFTY